MDIIYERKVNYYETDKMGVVHHANYIKYFEEARVYFMDKTNLSYKKIEDMGIIMPVLSVNAVYKHSARFDDVLKIKTRLTALSAAKAAFAYEITIGETENLACSGSSSHGFLTSSFSPLNVKREYPEIYSRLSSLL